MAKNVDILAMARGFIAVVSKSFVQLKESDNELGIWQDVQTKKLINPNTGEKLYCLNYCLITADKKSRDAIEQVISKIMEVHKPEDGQEFFQLGGKRYGVVAKGSEIERIDDLGDVFDEYGGNSK